MRISSFSIASALAGAVLVAAMSAAPARAQETALDAAGAMAGILGGAGGGVSGAEALAALESAAAAGQPLALWHLGVMYETGDGVERDPVRAFGYFSQIANDHADAAPRGLEADIVARSFVKIGDYYRVGLPDAGIAADEERSLAMLFHAASYFGDADAQYRVGRLYLEEESALGHNPLQSARWLSLAARKGHAPAQAVLGDLLFNGNGIAPQPVEGLMWLTLANGFSAGSPEHSWVNELLNRAMSIATPDQRAAAIEAAETYGHQFNGS